MHMLIRRAEKKDLDEFVLLCGEHAEYEGAEYQKNGQAERLAHALFVKPERVHAWVVESDGPQLAGYMTATVDYATWTARAFLHMDCLFLREQWRRRGIGTRLVDELRRFAAELGCSLIQWQTPADNVSGIEFYRSIGAHSRNKLRFYLEVSSD
jgi:ribosomal protein S18 acetylase RimI-like enzyme